MVRAKNKLVCGWGINDVDYSVTKYETLNGKEKKVWVCPYYLDWVGMIQRCFSPRELERYPSYKGCTIELNWKYFSNFIDWVNTQPNKNWVSCNLDKDFLISGNKHYSPDTAVYIPADLNMFIISAEKGRGGCMIGVCRHLTKKKNPFQANCHNPFTKEQEYLGVFPTELEAHKAWQAKKYEYACQLADLQPDYRLANRLREMYAPDKDWTNR